MGHGVFTGSDEHLRGRRRGAAAGTAGAVVAVLLIVHAVFDGGGDGMCKADGATPSMRHDSTAVNEARQHRRDASPETPVRCGDGHRK